MEVRRCVRKPAHPGERWVKRVAKELKMVRSRIYSETAGSAYRLDVD